MEKRREDKERDKMCKEGKTLREKSWSEDREMKGDGEDRGRRGRRQGRRRKYTNGEGKERDKRGEERKAGGEAKTNELR